MKRMHIHVGVENLDQSINFYSALFGTQPAKIKADYAKWMLDDPRINFAISTRVGTVGVDHLGIQVDEIDELDVLREQFKGADMSVFDEGEIVCCYARSEKTWVKDPSGVAWEVYKNMEDAQLYASAPVEEEPANFAIESESSQNCCVPSDTQTGSCG